ncbi:hypothetical protein EDD86DRAFT_199769 [Gorgonomyces haynaldii]|nr:hypothetical protein EDD86DRAFT_199769 [Gorgonomyces haynaldii]
MHLRLPNGDKIPIQLDNISETSVLQLKERAIQLASGMQLTLETVRLVCRGRILQNDELMLSDYQITQEDVIHVARKQVQEQPTSKVPQRTNPLGLSNEQMQEIANNPMVQHMLSDPQFIRSMIESDPNMKRMAEHHPEIREQLNNPEFLKNVGDMIKNPAAMQEMLRNQDRQLSNIESIPGAFPQLASLYGSMHDPSFSRESDPSTEEANRRFAERLGVQSLSTSDGPNSQALPNVWAPANQRPEPQTLPSMANPPMNPSGNPLLSPFALPNPPMMPGNLFSLGNPTSPSAANPLANPVNPLANPYFNLPPNGQFNPFGFMPFPVPQTQPEEPVEVRYHEQLITLREMGFDNEEKNKRALLASGGNTEAAINYLLQM